MNRVFKADLTGEASLEIVRLLNRMVKERRFKIHPRVLSCLHQLRLRTELGVRASDSAADKAKDKPHSGTKKPEKPHLSKKAKKTLKEKKEIDKELREAEAEVDKAERASRVSFSRVITLRTVISYNTANRDVETIVCVVFQDTQKSSPITSSPRSIIWDIEICTLGQHQLFQRPPQSLERFDSTRIRPI